MFMHCYTDVQYRARGSGCFCEKIVFRFSFRKDDNWNWLSGVASKFPQEEANASEIVDWKSKVARIFRTKLYETFLFIFFYFFISTGISVLLDV